MQANPEQGEVDVVVGGQTFTLKLSMRAARQLQKRNKKTIGELSSAAQRLDYEAIGELMFALLQEYHEKDFPTLKEVDAFIDRAGGPRVFFDFCQGLEDIKESGKAPGVEGAQDPQTAQAGTGESSRLQLAV
jgi:hypothetical protein